jgi:hypothetical protein
MTNTRKAASLASVAPPRLCAQQAARAHGGNVADRAADLRKHLAPVDVPPGCRSIGGTKAVTTPGHAERRETPLDGTRRRWHRPIGGTR